MQLVGDFSDGRAAGWQPMGNYVAQVVVSRVSH
jgi:hypothetical protein